jgi:TatD DNase family protein
MHFVDTHCHIQSSAKTSGDAGEAVTVSKWAKIGHPGGDELIARAAQYGVKELVCVGCSLPDSELAVDFVQGRENCYASIGIHPHEAKDYVDDAAKRDAFAQLAERTKVVAVGECGLDYFYEHSDPASQQSILRFQMELAVRHDLPMIFHVREALDDFWPIYDSFDRPIRGVLHSFTDTRANLDKAVERGLYVGVNGIATFTKSEAQLDMYRAIPLKNLVLETDSPFLTPSPYRGNICEPYHISVTAEYLAHLRETSLSDLAAATTANAHNLFNL